MAIKALRHRVERVRQGSAMTQLAGRIVIISPDDWSVTDQVAYEAARDHGDRATQADILERWAGRRPVFPIEEWRLGMPPAVIEIRIRPDGPQ